MQIKDNSFYVTRDGHKVEVFRAIHPALGTQRLYPVFGIVYPDESRGETWEDFDDYEFWTSQGKYAATSQGEFPYDIIGVWDKRSK